MPVSCRISYSVVSYLFESFSGLITSVCRFGKRELFFLLSFTCNYVVSVRRGFLFLWVLGISCVILLCFHIIILLCVINSYISSLDSGSTVHYIEYQDTIQSIIYRYSVSHRIVICVDFKGTLLTVKYHPHDRLLRTFN